MRTVGWLLVLLLLIVAGAWALASLALTQKKVQTDTVFGTVREVVVKVDRGDIDIVPASGLIEVRETRHWVVSQPELEQTREWHLTTTRSGPQLLSSVPRGRAQQLRRRRGRRAAGLLRIRAIAEPGDARVSGLRRNNRSLQSVHARTGDGDVTVRARARAR